MNNVCRPFSHALVDDVERWTRDEKHVHEVIDAIISELSSLSLQVSLQPTTHRR